VSVPAGEEQDQPGRDRHEVQEELAGRGHGEQGGEQHAEADLGVGRPDDVDGHGEAGDAEAGQKLQVVAVPSVLPEAAELMEGREGGL